MWKGIQQFGPQHCDLPTLVSNINVLFRVLALNVDCRDTAPVSPASRALLALCLLFYYYAYQLSMLWFATTRHHEDDLAAVIVFISLAISSHCAVIKLLHMLALGTKVQCLVKQCLETDALTIPNSRYSRKMAVGLKTVKIRVIFFWITLNLISVMYNTIPAFLPGRHLQEDHLVFYGLDPSSASPNYELTYTTTVICVTFICYIVSIQYAFVITVIGYTEVQLLSLSEEILCIWEDSVEETIEFKLDFICAFLESKFTIDDSHREKVNVGVRGRLVDIMQKHSRIMTLLKDIDAFFNVPNAVAFAGLVISLIAELLGGLENTYLQVPFTFGQVALDCYIGQMVLDASLKLERAVYACKWENFDNENMKIVLLMLQNSQKTLKVTAGGMAVMNFSCLMSIMRSVYSTYTTLHSTMRKKA